jgi:pimeloyl-ACP methyl ester carboxylesterase
MAVVSGTRFSFTDTANNAIDMSETLAMISPFDVPLLSIIGKDSLSKPATATKHEWLEDSLRPLDTTLATQGEFSGTGAVTTATVAAGTGVYLAAGDVIQIDNELCLINSISTDTLNILAGGRGYGGSSAASHVTTTPIRIVGTVALQGAPVGPARTTTKTGLFNYTQIYNSSVTITSTQRSTDKWTGPSNELARRLDDELKVAWQIWERSLLSGRKVAPSSGVASAMDGILPRLSTNAYAKAGAALVEDFILQAMQDVWQQGGRVTHIFANAFQKRQANKFLDSYRETTRTDRIAGAVVDTYTSDFGTADIVLDRNLPTDTVLLISKDRIGFGPLQGNALRAAKLPDTTLLAETWQVVGEYTAEVRNENAHAKITGLSTS